MDLITSLKKRARPAPPVAVRGDADALDPEARRARQDFKVALVSMPFVSSARPSIQIGLLKAIAGSHGFPVDTHHLSLELAARLGTEVYEPISDFGRCFLGDWLFADAAYGAASPDKAHRFIEDYSVGPLLEQIGKTPDYLLHLRYEEIPRYLDHLMASVDWGQYRVVGFTSTFQQNLASFALAARIKARYPRVATIFGGANFDGEMGPELVRANDFIDYAIVGEGDVAFPEFLIALSSGLDPADVPGVAARRDGAVKPPSSRPPFEDMDQLPVPDYDEYFARARKLGLLATTPRRSVEIPFESARGCWWGAKQHCIFCGLNGSTMSFRAKSPERTRKDLALMAQRYRSFRFEAVDNIVDMSYLKTLFAELVAEEASYDLFYEIKSNLTREQIRLLSDAGVRRLQPGIESMSSPILKLMRKGVTAIQNVNTMRWCQHYDVHVGWNLLLGFPGETAEHYRDQAAVLRRLFHLRPPGGIGPLWMERFSPIYKDRALFPTRYMRPQKGYGYLYPGHVDIDRVAYFFDYEFEQKLPEEAYAETHAVVKAWQEAWKKTPRPRLEHWKADGFLMIEDTRDPESAGTHTFDDPLAALYLACSERPASAERVKRELSLPWPEQEIEGALDEFCARGLMMREGKLFLSLATPAVGGGRRR
ncbi:RiPP maturation radical SAM C-methyltransferase [Sorangium sp. So ce1182]|uniref:RiPP maturation radical SAM C-methyltransferase n=1 Tax=Sorangium sp. So ce1182 TaxID=3133334 RepID=UPI003F6385DB